MEAKPVKRRISSFQIIIFGFLVLILLGCGVLMLPISSASGEGVSFYDAIFTATSAVCVTGLVVRDTAQYWSAFGQVVILCLIQIGGMGVVTVAVFAAAVSGKKIGLMQRSVMQESIAAPHIGGIVRLTEFILKTVLVVELVGAVLMMPSFCREFGLRGVWYAVFHSISAFCNAGFDLMGSYGKFSSLTPFAFDPLINLTAMALIVVGGIGFLTWDDIRINKLRVSRYRMQSKVVISMSLGLIVLPFLFFFFYEFASPVWAEYSPGQRFWLALFQAVSPRTAGFNTADLAAMSEPSQAVTMVLMLIGGSSGSTAGGMKTTTVAVLLASAISVFKRSPDAELYRRRIPTSAIRNAGAILLIYVTLFLAGGIALSCIEKLPLILCLFETASAIGTVGLTLGITSTLSLASRWVLIVLMFLGRVGGLTLVYATISVKRTTISRRPEDTITVC